MLPHTRAHACARALPAGNLYLITIADVKNCAGVVQQTTELVQSNCGSLVKSDPGFYCLPAGTSVKLLGVKKTTCGPVARALRNLANAISGVETEISCVENFLSLATKEACEQVTDDMNGALQYSFYNRTDKVTLLSQCGDPTTQTTTVTSTVTSGAIDAAIACKEHTTVLGSDSYRNASGDQVCPCSNCLANEHRVKQCSSAANAECQKCTECALGSYQTRNCTATADSQCTTCETCADGTYLSAWCQGRGATQCKACSSNCASCSGPGDICTVCAFGFYLQAGVCVKSCAAGSYELQTGNGKVCASCHSTCATCSGPGQLDCKDCTMKGHQAAALSTVGACQLDPARGCKANEYLDTTQAEPQCAQCDGTCASCFGKLATQCLTCDPAGTTPKLTERRFSFLGALIVRFECVATCPKGRYPINKNAAYKHPVCGSCGPQCNKCTDSTTCQVCEPGWVLGSGKCHVLTPSSAAKDLQGKGTQVTYSAGSSSRGPTACKAVVKTSLFDVAAGSNGACRSHARVLNQMVTLCHPQRKSVAPFACAGGGGFPQAPSLQLHLARCDADVLRLNKILKDLEPRARKIYTPLSCTQLGNVAVLTFAKAASELACGSTAASLNRAMGMFARGEYQSCGDGFTTATTTVTSSATTTVSITASSTLPVTATTTPTTTGTTKQTCNGKEDHPDCDSISITQCKLPENATGFPVINVCPVLCDSCITIVPKCNGVVDPAECEGVLAGKCDSFFTGIDVNVRCPATCGTCQLHDKPTPPAAPGSPSSKYSQTYVFQPPAGGTATVLDVPKFEATLKGKLGVTPFSLPYSDGKYVIHAVKAAGTDKMSYSATLWFNSAATSDSVDLAARTSGLAVVVQKKVYTARPITRWQCISVGGVVVPTLPASQCTADAVALNKIGALCQANLPPVVCSQVNGRSFLQIKAIGSCPQVAASISGGIFGMGKKLPLECVSGGRLGTTGLDCTNTAMLLEDAAAQVGQSGSYQCDASAFGASETTLFYFVRDDAYRAAVDAATFNEELFLKKLESKLALDMSVAGPQVKVQTFNQATGAVLVKLTSPEVAALAKTLVNLVTAGFAFVHDGKSLRTSATVATSTAAAAAAAEEGSTSMVPILIAVVAGLALLLAFFTWRQSRAGKGSLKLEKLPTRTDMFSKPAGGYDDQLDNGLLDHTHTTMRKKELVQDLHNLAKDSDLNEGLYADDTGYLEVNEFEATADMVTSALPKAGASFETYGDTATYDYASNTMYETPQADTDTYAEVGGTATAGAAVCAYASARGNCKRISLPSAGSLYCQNHTCGMVGCLEERSSRDDYCATHQGDTTALTRSQLAATNVAATSVFAPDASKPAFVQPPAAVVVTVNTADVDTTSFSSPTSEPDVTVEPLPSAEISFGQPHSVAPSPRTQDGQIALTGVQMMTRAQRDSMMISPKSRSTPLSASAGQQDTPQGGQQYWKSQFADRAKMFN